MTRRNRRPPVTLYQALTAALTCNAIVAAEYAIRVQGLGALLLAVTLAYAATVAAYVGLRASWWGVRDAWLRRARRQRRPALVPAGRPPMAAPREADAVLAGPAPTVPLPPLADTQPLPRVTVSPTTVPQFVPQPPVTHWAFDAYPDDVMRHARHAATVAAGETVGWAA